MPPTPARLARRRARPLAAWLVALAALLVASIAVACGDDGPAPRSAGAAELEQSGAPRAEADAEAGREAAAAMQALAADLYAVLARDGGEDGNVVFSPYSVATALAMTRAGAAGETARQMDEVLHAALAGDLHGGVNAIEQALAERPGEYPLEFGDDVAELELATANQLWGQQGFHLEAAYLDLLASHYGAGMRLVDFAGAPDESRELINEWVSEQTRERIPELIPEGVLDAMTRLVLTNAIYLNAPWLHPFEETATAPGPFTRIDGSEVEADLMSLGARLNYGAGDGYQAVELPYIDGSLSMVVVVPDAGTFQAFEDELDAATLDDVLANLGDVQVDLRLPRFEFRTQAGLREALGELGMPVAFEPGEADFSGINRELGRDFYLQDVIHEAFISVDEAGTEAAAATAVVVGIVSAPTDVAELTVDRPFLFLIRDQETGALLFMGRVLDPTA